MTDTPRDEPGAPASPPVTAGGPGTPEQRVAYLLWQVNEGYIKAEDRAIGTNWFLTPVGSQDLDAEAERQGWLEAAADVIAVVKAELLNPHAETENALAQAEAGWGRVGGGWCGDRDCGIPEHNHKPYDPS